MDTDLQKMKDYRITVKVRNNRLLRAIEDAGGSPGNKWCKANGLGYLTVNRLINMARSPLTAEGDLLPTAARMCEVLDKLPEDLWSNEQLYPLERNFTELEMDHAQVVAMLPAEQQFYIHDDLAGIEQAQTEALVTRALSKLTQREQEVIKMRFEDDLNHNECAKRLGLSNTRIRQLEKRAIRKLRHPAMIGGFKGALR